MGEIVDIILESNQVWGWIPLVAAGIAAAGKNRGDRESQRRQYQNERRLMGLGLEHQQMLNQQGHDLQYDMWNKTNYGAQVQHMLDAGLNPALMYGQAGQGGTTGSQGGGSAQGGHAQMQAPMDLGAIVQAGLMKAQMDKLKAEKDNIDKDTELKGENITKTVEETAKLVTEKLNVEQSMSESKQRELNLKTEEEIKAIDRDWLKKHHTSTYDHALIRALKSTGMTLLDAMNYYVENGDQMKIDIKKDENWETGSDSKGEYMIDKRTGKKIYY